MLAVLLAGSSLTACDSGSTPTTDVVGPGDALTAIVAWQADEQEPVLDANGVAQLPVIFIVADVGTTIDVGVQAQVAKATADRATVRFADDVADTFDSGVDGEPVRNHGVMLLVAPMPDAGSEVTVDLARYATIDQSEQLQFHVTADVAPTGTDDSPPRAAVTSVTRP